MEDSKSGEGRVSPFGWGSMGPKALACRHKICCQHNSRKVRTDCNSCCPSCGGVVRPGLDGSTATWLILPVVIRSSQRLSHACLSVNIILWNCERLIISVIIYLIVPYYLDNRSNSRANTCVDTLLGWYLLDGNQPLRGDVVNHNKLADRRWRWIIQVSALSALDGKVLAYRGFNG